MQPTSEVVYKVDHVKIGSSFCTVLVNGIQKSRIQFHCMISFQKALSENHEIDYCTRDMPDIPKPVEDHASKIDYEKKNKFRLLSLTKQMEDRLLDVSMCVKRHHAKPAKPE